MRISLTTSTLSITTVLEFSFRRFVYYCDTRIFSNVSWTFYFAFKRLYGRHENVSTEALGDTCFSQNYRKLKPVNCFCVMSLSVALFYMTYRIDRRLKTFGHPRFCASYTTLFHRPNGERCFFSSHLW